MIHGDIILTPRLSGNKIFDPNFHRDLQVWAKEHNGEVAFQQCDFSSEEAIYECHVLHCFIRPDEITNGLVDLGCSRANVAKGQIVNLGPAGQHTFNFVEWLEEFFQRGNIQEEEQHRILDMPLKEFLAFCIAATEHLEPALQTPPTGTPEPTVWGIPRKALLSGQKVKCPACGGAYLITTDGQVECPMCQRQFGDIDMLPEVF